MQSFHHAFTDHRHFQMSNESDDARRPVLVCCLDDFDADPCKNFALPADHRPIAWATNYIFLQTDCSTKRHPEQAYSFRSEYGAKKPSTSPSVRRLQLPHHGSKISVPAYDANASPPL